MRTHIYHLTLSVGQEIWTWFSRVLCLKVSGEASARARVSSEGSAGEDLLQAPIAVCRVQFLQKLEVSAPCCYWLKAILMTSDVIHCLIRVYKPRRQ